MNSLKFKKFEVSIDNLKDNQRYLIDYANISQGLIENQSQFVGYKKLREFGKKISMGIPLILPVGLKEFDYQQKNHNFNIEKEYIQKHIFNASNKNYIGLKLYLKYGNTFSSEATPKKKYLSLIKDIKKNNLLLINKIKRIKKAGNTVAAFQTRNIPHFGHEKIIKDLLSKFDYVIINPVIGPKKIGDAKSELLSLVYNFLGKEYYDNKIIFHPLCANMFYAGPREAIHHALLRQKLGFSGFVIGRDHAGAENNYHPDAAKIQINRIKNKFTMEIVTQDAIYFDNFKNEIVVKKNKRSMKNTINISGTEFRKCLVNKRLYKYARSEIQKMLYDTKRKIFY